MSRAYTVSFENVSITAAGTDQDFFYLAPAANKPLQLYGLVISNVGGTADAGDAQEEFLRFAVIRGHTTVGSGGAVVTPAKVKSSVTTTASFTARRNDTTIASVGTTETLHADGFNVRTGICLFPPELAWWGCSAVETSIVVRMLSTVADDIAMSATLYVLEGG